MIVRRGLVHVFSCLTSKTGNVVSPVSLGQRRELTRVDALDRMATHEELENMLKMKELRET